MRFFLDENFPKTAKPILQSYGHEVIDIRGTEHEGSDDVDIFTLVQEARAVFLTTDADFYHTIPHLFTKHDGIVVITLHQPNRQNILNRLVWFLENFTESSISGHVFRLRDRTYRVYPALDLHDDGNDLI